MTTIVNKSDLHPLGQAVLLIPYEPDLYVKTTRIIIPDSYKKQLRMVENRGVILEIGPEAWGTERTPRAKVGDKIIFSKHAGYMAEGTDGKLYRVVNADDIFLRIEDGIDLEQLLTPDRPLPSKFDKEPLIPGEMGPMREAVSYEQAASDLGDTYG